MERQNNWTPPARPDWVARINEEGRLFDLKDVVPLDEASLISAATANTGLNDFGEDGWREPFRLLIKSLNEEAHLTLMGRLMTRNDILLLLESRLRIEDAYKKHPEIEDQEIVKPFWVFGQGRSGTSLLQTLLGADPRNRDIKIWEAMFPEPFSERGPDTRKQLAHDLVTQWNRVTPEVMSMHEFASEAQTETIQFEAFSFQTPAWLNLLGNVPSFNAYIAKQGFVPSLRYAKRVFKLMQWRNPGRKWVLKSPDSIGYLPDVLKVFPDAQLIWAHRDPVRALASATSFVATLMWIRSDEIQAGAFQQITDPKTVAYLMGQPIAWLEQGIVPKSQLCNLHYVDLIADPLGTIAKIYEFFGIEFPVAARDAIAGYLRNHPRDKRPPHRYSIGSEQEIKALYDLLKFYQEYFNVPVE